MTHYRLYFHDKGGHFARAEDIEAESDESALRTAETFDHPFAIEVWEKSRRVAVTRPLRLRA